MSKENAIKFCELIGKNPEILKEGEKHDKGQGDVYVIFSDLAKEKGFDCEASELKEVMDQAQNTTSELDIDDLENVAGGAAKRTTTEKSLLITLQTLGGALKGLSESADKDGKIHWRNVSTYTNICGNAISEGTNAWMNSDNEADDE